jgi:hypothetical protein
MSSLRYFEFDSTYRNRTQYPNPADFVIDIAQSGQKSREQALDPVSEASPVLEWNNSFQELFPSNTISSITMSPVAPESTINNTTFQITVPSATSAGPGGFRQVNNFYNGASIYITISTITYSRRIVSYNYLNLTNAIISLDTPMEDIAFTAGATATISNPTPIPTSSASSIIQFFIPTGPQIDNFYVNYYLQVLESPVITSPPYYAQIKYYNGLTRMATLSGPTSQDWASATYANANFCIRKALPANTNRTSTTTSGSIYGINSNGTALQLDVNQLINSQSGFYTNSALRILQITGGGLPPAANGFSNISTATNQPFQQEAIISKFQSGAGSFLTFSTTSGISSFTLNADRGHENYVGCLITDISIASPYSTGLITSATLNTSGVYSYTVNSWSNGTPSAGHNWVICTAFINYTMTNPSHPGPGFIQNPPIYPTGSSYPTYEIEQFTRENYTPFIYTGSTVSSQQEVCYEIELVNLVLPNTVLQSGRGGRPIFYPYLYVELQQIASSNSHQKGIIYSNNPHSYKMLFRALVNDTATPASSPFIKIDGDSMTHVIKFKPNDSFKLAVYHSNGTIFQTVATDTTPPSNPNPLVQISACFSFKRIS